MNDSLGAPAPLRVQAPRGRPLLELAETRRPIVVVLGPQYSGTSVCAYALSLLGVDITEADPATPNQQSVRQFHDRVLEILNRVDAGPFYDFALPVAWWADPRIAPVRREIAAFVEDKATSGNFGFADPRTVRLLPLWQQVFTELKLQPKFVLCLRNPGAAARSAQHRDGVDPDIAEYRWFVHMADFFRYAGRAEHCAIEYEAWCDEPSTNLDRLQNFLGLEWLHGAAERDLALASIAGLAAADETPGPEHGAEPRQPLVRSFYRLARSEAQSGVAGAREQIVQQFVAFQQLQKPIEKALAAHAAAAAEVAGQRDGLAADCAVLGAELATARTRLAEQDAALVRSKAQLEKAQSLLAAAEREREQLEAAAASARHEREAARLAGDQRAASLEAAVQSLRSEIAERDRAAEVLDARAAETAAQIAAAQAESDALRASLAQREAERDELQALVTAIRQELADARHAGEEHAAVLRTARRGLAEHERADAALRTELATAERLRRSEAEGRQALETEAAALRDSLAAARQVGQAAMRALAHAAVPAPPVERAGWLSTIRRRLGLTGR